MPDGSVDDEAVTAVVLTDQAAGNVQRFQLQTEPSHVDTQLFGLVFARPPAQANDLASREEAIGMAQEDRQQVPLLVGERDLLTVELEGSPPTVEGHAFDLGPGGQVLPKPFI